MQSEGGYVKSAEYSKSNPTSQTDVLILLSV